MGSGSRWRRTGAETLVLASNQNDNKVYLEGYNTNSNGNAVEMLLTGFQARSIPQISLVADKTVMTGSVQITGNLGTHAFSPNPLSAGWGGGIHTWDFEAEGTAWCKNGFITGNHDVAEHFTSNDTLEPGDVVCMDPQQDQIVRSSKPNDSLVMGIISTAPAIQLNAERGMDTRHIFPVALCGRVPCKVVDENGPIQRGDLLTASSIPGRAMKAKPSGAKSTDTYTAGTIIGKALESHAAGEGLIDIFVILR